MCERERRSSDNDINGGEKDIGLRCKGNIYWMSKRENKIIYREREYKVLYAEMRQ